MANLIRVSGASPFANCKFGGAGTAYTNSEVEPFIAVNPANSKNLIGVWQQDRWSNGFARGIMAGYSFDGGLTWGRAALPVSLCAAPNGFNYGRTVDGVVSIGPDGTAYAVAFSTNMITKAYGILACTSTNGGRTWGTTRLLISNRGPEYYNDKPSITADPKKPGVAYIVWDRLHRNTAGQLITGPTFFSKTTNYGKTWSTPRSIFSPGTGNSTIGAQIIVDPRNGRLYNFFSWQVASGVNRGLNLVVQRSNNGGTTWSNVTIIAQEQLTPVKTPNTGAIIRAGNLPQAAMGPLGRLYVVWSDARFSGGAYEEVAISYSSDGGFHWSTPTRVNPPYGGPAFTPSIAINSLGVAGVTYYDFRNSTSSTATTPTDYWIRYSNNGAVSFGEETHVAGPFDILTAPLTNGGLFLGDYQGLVTVGSTFHPFFAATTAMAGANPTDIFTAAIAD